MNRLLPYSDSCFCWLFRPINTYDHSDERVYYLKKTKILIPKHLLMKSKKFTTIFSLVMNVHLLSPLFLSQFYLLLLFLETNYIRFVRSRCFRLRKLFKIQKRFLTRSYLHCFTCMLALLSIEVNALLIFNRVTTSHYHQCI